MQNSEKCNTTKFIQQVFKGENFEHHSRNGTYGITTLFEFSVSYQNLHTQLLYGFTIQNTLLSFPRLTYI